MILVNIHRISRTILLQSREKLIAWESSFFYFFIVNTSLSGCFLQRKHVCAAKGKKFPELSWCQRSGAKPRDNLVLSVAFWQKHRGLNTNDKVLQPVVASGCINACLRVESSSQFVCLLHLICEHTVNSHAQHILRMAQGQDLACRSRGTAQQTTSCVT